MTYTFRGQFWGTLGPELTEPLAGVTVRLYKYRGTKYISSLAVAESGETLAILSAEAVSAKTASLLGEATTDADGNFALTLAEDVYKGEAFELDLLLRDLPGRKRPLPRIPIQVALTTMKPRWETSNGNAQAHWAYCVPPALWHEIRTRFDAWLIAGRVLAQQTGQPISGVKVTAYDADWLQDDELGSALTDAAGTFRIDYERAGFTRTVLSPLVNQEEGGPDLYFTVRTSSGVPLLAEPKTQGELPGRKDVQHYAFVELVVADVPEPV